MNHITDNPDALLDYLYEEGDSAERLTIAKHLQECAACAVAVLEFQNVRGMLSDWTPPASQLGFRVVQEGDTAPSAIVAAPSASHDQRARGGWSWGWGPTTKKEKSWGWGPTTHQEKLTGPRSRALLQAAAAILLFVSGMAVSQLSVEYRDGTLTVHTRPAAAPIRTSITLPPENTNPLTSDAPPAIESDENERERLLQRVRTMIDQSEQRQQRQLALRVSQVAREVDTQHKVDLLGIEQKLGQQQDATMEYLVRTSGGVK